MFGLPRINNQFNYLQQNLTPMKFKLLLDTRPDETLHIWHTLFRQENEEIPKGPSRMNVDTYGKKKSMKICFALF